MTTLLRYCITLLVLSISAEAAEPAGKATNTDLQIRDQIQQRMFWSPLINDEQVRVLVTNGVAVLSGAVEGWDSYGAAIEKAFEGGAENVRVELSVPGFTYKMLGSGTYEAFRTPAERTAIPDSELKKKIEQQMVVSPFVDRKDIKVTVKEGMAELTGQVDDYSSHGGATENAFEGGAVAVRNLLKVVPGK